MARKWRPVGQTCPEHTESVLRDVDGRLYCANQGHDGRPKTHPDGPAEPTNPFHDGRTARGEYVLVESKHGVDAVFVSEMPASPSQKPVRPPSPPKRASATPAPVATAENAFRRTLGDPTAIPVSDAERASLRDWLTEPEPLTLFDQWGVELDP